MDRPDCFGDFDPETYTARDCSQCQHASSCWFQTECNRAGVPPRPEPRRPSIMVRAVRMAQLMADPLMSYRWSGAWRAAR